MIRHVVLFKLTDPVPGAVPRPFETLRDALEPLATSVPGVLSLRVSADPGTIDRHWHAVLETEHDSWDDLARYQDHPAHRRAVATIDAIVAERAVVDYER
ncbi:Dabb family protein [Agromyces bracchium]|uniref:Stress-response A/B barrel domain-containing protein n=1 Tax=Agromyces bracchium TaxID=88376 RepID=A0A6I3M8A3_9MICO|nr:Dabb family protein [Agromyces bracchium]MTH69574.1 hypothetical protein [Agromyces bracchium]